MSDVRTAISPEQVQKTMSIVISTLKFVSTIIPGEADDKIVDVVSSLPNVMATSSIIRFSQPILYIFLRIKLGNVHCSRNLGPS